MGPPSGKIAVYKWDGKNLTQMTFSEIRETSVTVDYIKSFTLGQYAKDAVLKRPEDQFANFTKWVIFIAIMVGLIASTWSLYHSANVIAISAKNTPAANISAQNHQILIYLVKYLNTSSQRDNQTFAFMRNLTAYLQQHT